MRYLTSLLLVCAFVNLRGQQTEFRNIIADLQSNLSEVQTGDETYTHEIVLLEYSVLKYTLVEVDKKGNREEMIYEFNVADLDPYVVREETKQDIIYLSLTINNAQKFIKKYVDGVVKGYEYDMLMVSSSIDNARTMRDLIKKAIPLAQKIMDGKLSASTYPEMQSWLTSNVTNAAGNGGKSYNQSLVVMDDFSASVRFIQTTTTSKSSEEMQYIFNLADLNTNSLRFNISGSSFSLDLETKRKQKLIRVIKNGAPDGFANKIEFFTNNVEEARDLKSILTKVVPLAEDKVKASIRQFESAKAALDYLAQYIKNIDYGDESIEQSINGNCIMTLSQTESDDKSSSKLVSEFNLMDINRNLIDYAITSDKMYVEFATKESVDLIKQYENDAFDGYEDGIKIYAENVEIARRIKSALEDLIRICDRDYVDPFKDMTVAQKITWLTGNMGEVRVGDNTITQTFERIDASDLQKIKLTKLEVDSKGSKEEIFEFNFTDLNPKSIQYKIGSKTLAVTFETKFKEDIIKYYKDGEIENYQDGFELNFEGIEDARNVILVFNQIIDALNE